MKKINRRCNKLNGISKEDVILLKLEITENFRLMVMSFCGRDYHEHNKWSTSYDVFGEKANSTLEGSHQRTFSNSMMKESFCYWKPSGQLFSVQILLTLMFLAV